MINIFYIIIYNFSIKLNYKIISIPPGVKHCLILKSHRLITLFGF